MLVSSYNSLRLISDIKVFLNDVKRSFLVFSDIVQIVMIEMHVERQGFYCVVGGVLVLFEFVVSNLICSLEAEESKCFEGKQTAVVDVPGDTLAFDKREGNSYLLKCELSRVLRSSEHN